VFLSLEVQAKEREHSFRFRVHLCGITAWDRALRSQAAPEGDSSSEFALAVNDIHRYRRMDARVRMRFVIV